MRLIFAILFLLLFTITCTKDNFTTKPQLKIKSVNATDIFGNETLEFIIRLTDKEADFTSYFGIAAKTTSCPASDFTDSTIFQIPGEFISSKNHDGEIVLDLPQALRHANLCMGAGNDPITDTTVFSFWTKDRAGNVSDTVSSGPIIIHAQ